MPVVMLICLISYSCRLKAPKRLCCTVACAPTLNKSCLMSYVFTKLAMVLRSEEIRKGMPLATASGGGVANLAHDLFFYYNVCRR